ncbi:MAG: hypothetical protein ACYCW6_12460 [Candidatus Xenobia bacterium]
MILLYRGRPVLRLEPIRDKAAAEDPFYSLAERAEAGEGLDNEAIDRLLYGE